MEEQGTYDTAAAKTINLATLFSMFADQGVESLYVKKLAPNDNSKNQPYFGSHLTDLPFIPTGEIFASETTSKKNKAKNSKNKIKYQCSIDLTWIDAEGHLYEAPHAKLIYYPQYPEVRFSGFLKGANVDASEWMDPYKQGRKEGRWLVFGSSGNKVYMYLVTPECVLSNELDQSGLVQVSKVFSLIDFSITDQVDTKAKLIQKLQQIHKLGWIPGQKLNSQGVKEPYKALNAGGYTLEAELGVKPNGIAEPDYMGWEVKQFGVKDFPRKGTKPTTLMTPEPNGGFYVDAGAPEFVKCYGYPDKSGKPDRLNFGGKHLAGQICDATSLTLTLIGFDLETSSITDAKGSIALIDGNENIAASWSFEKLMNHWKRKHSQAVYIPCMSRQSISGQGKDYFFGKDIELGKGTNFKMILSAIHKGHVFYDPGIKLENVSSSPKIKKRSQFRVNHKDLSSLYKNFEFIDITN